MSNTCEHVQSSAYFDGGSHQHYWVSVPSCDLKQHQGQAVALAQSEVAVNEDEVSQLARSVKSFRGMASEVG